MAKSKYVLLLQASQAQVVWLDQINSAFQVISQDRISEIIVGYVIGKRLLKSELQLRNSEELQ